MSQRITRHLGDFIWMAFAPCWVGAAADAQTSKGLESEARCPPLKLPEGFKATRFAYNPLVESPSVIVAGPSSGAVFVAIDYLSGFEPDSPFRAYAQRRSIRGELSCSNHQDPLQASLSLDRCATIV